MPVDRIRQTRIAEPINNHKQGGEKHQQMPINQLEHFMCVAARQHHDERCARKRSPRQVESSEEAAKDQNKNNADDSKQSVVELRDSVRRSFDHRFSQTPPKTETQNCEVDRQSDDRHWQECARELRERNVRVMPNNHVLWIPYEGGDAADVRTGRERD